MSKIMPPHMDPVWLNLALVFLATFFGWRIKSAQDSVKVEHLYRQFQEMREDTNKRLSALENSRLDTAKDLSTIRGELTAIKSGVDRLQKIYDQQSKRIDGKQDRG